MRIIDSDSDRYKRSKTYSNTANTVTCCSGCSGDEWISCASLVLLLTETIREALQLPLSHICFTHCVFITRFLSVYSGGNFASADLIIMIV